MYALTREGCFLMQGYFFGKPKPYLEIVGDLAVQQFSPQLPAKDAAAFADPSKTARS